ncbi:hypothetical protein FGIG_05432 [Fasciola gigantica]|uniref:Uncharacterized protein n=1 Tax=Fasciola gigantica TaxID=46835 RepID=A0A504Z2N4_FASGI|nr:hypothetical protein FGIG_05432 [Fasciola gigantica]
MPIMIVRENENAKGVGVLDVLSTMDRVMRC